MNWWSWDCGGRHEAAYCSAPLPDKRDGKAIDCSITKWSN